MCRLLLLLILSLTNPVFAQETPDYIPRVANSKGQDFQDFPMGVLSATGRLNGGDTGISIRHVGDLGVAAKAGLQVDDVLVKVQNKALGRFSMNPDTGLAGPQATLAAEIHKACSGKNHSLQLTVVRDGKIQQLEAQVPACPKFNFRAPGSGEFGKKYLAGICDFLVRTQRSDGTWKPGVGGDASQYTAAMCGLTLLSGADKKYLPAIKKSVDFIMRTRTTAEAINLETSAGPKNWIAATSAMFLAEYYLATGDRQVLENLYRCCDLLARRVSPGGQMGHSVEITYNGGGLTIINAHAHLAWALAEQCGYKINQDAWNRSMSEVLKATTKNGGVGYSSRARGDSDAPARTGGIASSLLISERGNPQQVSSYLAWIMKFNNRLRHAHANCSMGLIFSTWALKLGDRKSHAKHMRNWMPYLELCRAENMHAQFFGSKKNFGGDSYLGLTAIGNATVGLMLSTSNRDLFLCGGKKKNWLEDKSNAATSDK